MYSVKVCVSRQQETDEDTRPCDEVFLISWISAFFAVTNRINPPPVYEDRNTDVSTWGNKNTQEIFSFALWIKSRVNKKEECNTQAIVIEMKLWPDSTLRMNSKHSLSNSKKSECTRKDGFFSAAEAHYRLTNQCTQENWGTTSDCKKYKLIAYSVEDV